MSLRIGPANPSHGAAIEALFVRGGRDDFPRLWREAYPAAAARSLIAQDASGAVVMHVALFPCTIGDGRRRWRGALLGDLLADEQHRDFFGPVQLVRATVAEARAAGIALLYSDPTPPARGVLRAAGFRELGSLRRHVMPTAMVWRVFSRMRAGRPPVVTSVHDAGDPGVFGDRATMLAGPVRVWREAASSMGRVSAGRWLRMEAPGSAGAAALALMHVPAGENRAVVMDLAWREGVASAPRALLAASRWAARERLRTIDVHVLDTSDVAAALRRSGFLPRADQQPIVTLRLDGDPVPPASEWFLNRIDGSAWWRP